MSVCWAGFACRVVLCRGSLARVCPRAHVAVAERQEGGSHLPRMSSASDEIPLLLLGIPLACFSPPAPSTEMEMVLPAEYV
jgi:hypothetical protein